MVRILGQILLGLTLLFGVIMMAMRIYYYLREENIKKVIYYSFLWVVMLFFTLIAFLFALTEMRIRDWF